MRVSASCSGVNLRRKGMLGDAGTQEVPPHKPFPGVLAREEVGKLTEDIMSHNELDMSCSCGKLRGGFSV